MKTGPHVIFPVIKTNSMNRMKRVDTKKKTEDLSKTFFEKLKNEQLMQSAMNEYSTPVGNTPVRKKRGKVKAKGISEGAKQEDKRSEAEATGPE